MLNSHKIPTLALIIALAATLGFNDTSAHGIHTYDHRGQATIFTVTYADGSPMAGASFTVHSPEGGPTFMTGQTDRLGRVIFIPDAAGKWEIRVFSDDGHGATASIEINPNYLTKDTYTPHQSMGRTQKMITGVSILFGIFGLLVLAARRKK